MDTFTCRRCGEVREDKARRKHNICKPCNREEAREYRASNPAKRLFYAARQRAKQSGIEFSITEADVVIPTRCPVFGTELIISGSSRENYDNSPSLDRIDPTLGYVPGNVAVISNRANRIKNNATQQELMEVIKWLTSL